MDSGISRQINISSIIKEIKLSEIQLHKVSSKTVPQYVEDYKSSKLKGSYSSVSPPKNISALIKPHSIKKRMGEDHIHTDTLKYQKPVSFVNVFDNKPRNLKNVANQILKNDKAHYRWDSETDENYKLLDKFKERLEECFVILPSKIPSTTKNCNNRKETNSNYSFELDKLDLPNIRRHKKRFHDNETKDASINVSL